MRPRLLDLYAGEGGAGRGYHDAGFDVVGVDTSTARLRRYPYECHQGDAITYLLDHGHEYDAIHASPPCTGYTQATSAIPDRLAKYDRLIGATRAALMVVGRPWVIENVTSAVTRAELRDPVMLCWTEFYPPGSVIDDDGTPLWMRRHRLFESSMFLLGAGGCRHPQGMQCAGSYSGARSDKAEARDVRHGGYTPAGDVQRALLGTPWMSDVGCRLSIPPVYAAFVGAQLIAHLDQLARAS